MDDWREEARTLALHLDERRTSSVDAAIAARAMRALAWKVMIFDPLRAGFRQLRESLATAMTAARDSQRRFRTP